MQIESTELARNNVIVKKNVVTPNTARNIDLQITHHVTAHVYSRLARRPPGVSIDVATSIGTQVSSQTASCLVVQVYEGMQCDSFTMTTARPCLQYAMRGNRAGLHTSRCLSCMIA